MKKFCFQCKIKKEKKDFNKCAGVKDGLSSWGRSCQSKYMKKWKINNPIKLDINRKKYYLKRYYKMSPLEYNERLQKQKNKCLICFRNFSIMRACIDHSHKNKKVRGIICFNCNSGLGHFRDNATILKNAIGYLKYYE